MEAHGAGLGATPVTLILDSISTPAVSHVADVPPPSRPMSLPAQFAGQPSPELAGAPVLAAGGPVVRPAPVLTHEHQPAAVPAPAAGLQPPAAPPVAQSPVAATVQLQPARAVARPLPTAQQSPEILANLPRSAPPKEDGGQAPGTPVRPVADEPLADSLPVQPEAPLRTFAAVIPAREAAAAVPVLPEASEPAATTWRLELAPPLMGEVEIEIVHEGVRVSAKAVVQQPGTVETLRAIETQVRDALERQGLQLSGFEVSCRDDGPNQGQPDRPVVPLPMPGREQERAHARPARPQAHAAPDGLVDIYV